MAIMIERASQIGVNPETMEELSEIISQYKKRIMIDDVVNLEKAGQQPCTLSHLEELKIKTCLDEKVRAIEEFNQRTSAPLSQEDILIKLEMKTAELYLKAYLDNIQKEQQAKCTKDCKIIKGKNKHKAKVVTISPQPVKIIEQQSSKIRPKQSLLRLKTLSRPKKRKGDKPKTPRKRVSEVELVESGDLFYLPSQALGLASDNKFGQFLKVKSKKAPEYLS